MQILTVSEFSYYFQTMLRSDDVLRDVWIEGEVSGLTRTSAGHCYFTLKDGNAQLSAVCFRRSVARLKALPQQGEQVYAHGEISFYEGSGKLQIVVDDIRSAGIGLLNARFEELKARLEREGLFDSQRKRGLPSFPKRIGIATSPTGAVIHDMANVIRRRYPLLEIILSPCQVQGESAPQSIIAALERLYELDLDLIILARGGGSTEDLDCFNNEQLARVVYASPVPIVTGVGHETDTTIVDYVADLRTPTPSAAAELITPDRIELQADLRELRERLNESMFSYIDTLRNNIHDSKRRLELRSPQQRLSRDRQRIDDMVRSMQQRIRHNAQLRRVQLDSLTARLRTLSPLATLQRGYAVVQSADGSVVVTPEQAERSDTLKITVREGSFEVQVLPSAPKRTKRQRKTVSPTEKE